MDDTRARELLADARSAAEGMLASLEGRAGGDDDEQGDPGDSAAELQEDGVEQGRAEDVREQLAAIERAEERLANGEYGRSVDSGETIPDGRLEAVPWAERTVAEEQRIGG
jgi:DnaK suppressor protein